MSEGQHNMSDQQAVVGEPAFHPHQAVVVGEPPQAANPVLGEPAFANGLQDRQLVLPPAGEDTSVNGIQSGFHTPPSSDFSTPVEESSNLQQASSAEASASGIGVTSIHQLEPPAAENLGLVGALADEASGASDASVVRSTAVGTPAHNLEGESGVDFPDVVEVTHIVDSPSAATPFLNDGPSENPYAALDEGEEFETEAEENPDGESAVSDGSPTLNASPSPGEISTEGPGHQQDQSSSVSPAQEKTPIDSSGSTQTDSVEGIKSVDENASLNGAEQGSQGHVVSQNFDSNEPKFEKEDHDSSVSPFFDLDKGSEGATMDTTAEPETTARDLGNSLNKEGDKLSRVDENYVDSRKSQSKEETMDELRPVDSAVGAHDIAVEDGLAANGDNSYQQGEDVVMDREQDLSKVDDDTCAGAEKSGFRSKLPLIFTGLAIAALGVVLAAISKSRLKA